MGVRDTLRTLFGSASSSDQAVGEVISEAAPTGPPVRPGIANAATVNRLGYDSDVPYGGANKLNPGGDYPDDRRSFMQSLYVSYTGCPWLSAPIDAIARTVTAGGLSIDPTADADDTTAAVPTEPPPGVLALQQLVDFCNPHMDIVQLLRGVVTDLGIYGDSFIEVVWLLGLPVALYPLDPATMTVDADEHGNVFGYDQVLGTREARFEANEVIHISMDAPKGSLYGMGIAQKALLPVTVWLFTAAAVKETMKKGDPPTLHFNFPLEVSGDDVRAWRGQYQVRNLGTQNIGNPITTRGPGVTAQEFKLGALTEYLAIQDNARDTILSVAGVPPSKVGVIESGNLGGGTGTSQDKTFRVNTCGPAASIVLEKLNYALTEQAFGIDGWALNFKELDWRDDAVVEDIRDKRIKNGLWSLNDARADIDLPPVGPEGDAHILALTRVILDWADLAEYSGATVDGLRADADAARAKADQAAEPPAPAPMPPPEDSGAAPSPPQAPPPAPAPGAPAKAPEETAAPSWRDRVLEHYHRLLSDREED